MSARIEELTLTINELRAKLQDPSKCGCNPESLQKRLDVALAELASLNEALDNKSNLLKG
jgi:hypothetical protein